MDLGCHIFSQAVATFPNACMAIGSIILLKVEQEGGLCVCEIACLLAQMEGLLKSQAELQVRLTELTIAVRCIVWLSAHT